MLLSSFKIVAHCFFFSTGVWYLEIHYNGVINKSNVFTRFLPAVGSFSFVSNFKGRHEGDIFFVWGPASFYLQQCEPKLFYWKATSRREMQAEHFCRSELYLMSNTCHCLCLYVNYWASLYVLKLLPFVRNWTALVPCRCLQTIWRVNEMWVGVFFTDVLFVFFISNLFLIYGLWKCFQNEVQSLDYIVTFTFNKFTMILAEKNIQLDSLNSEVCF